MRYRRARTGNLVEVHGVLPVQVRHRGTLLQVATAQQVDAALLRDALYKCSASSNVTLTIQPHTVAPWREWGWQPWPGRNSQ